MKFCASCEKARSPTQVVKTTEKQLPEWLSQIDYVSQFIEGVTSFKTQTPPRAHLHIKVSLGKQHRGKALLYWGAEPTRNPRQVVGARRAYGSFSNHGITNVNARGEAEIYIQCPQPYKAIPHGGKREQAYHRHIHFCLSNTEKTKWGNTVYTKVVVCHLSRKETETASKKKSMVIVNALPCEYYGRDHIPNSYNLPYKVAGKMTGKEVDAWMREVIDLHYPKVAKMALHEVPILTYCAHSGCNASELLVQELQKRGYVNLFEFKGGMKEWREKNH